MTAARVVGLGRRTAGDDGVGLVILDRLRALAPPGVELVEVAEPSALIPLLACAVPVVIVDAVVTPRGVAGEILELDAAALSADVRSVSTHGIGVAQAVAVARVVVEPIAPSIRIVGVTVATPLARTDVLSATVEAALPRAIQRVLQSARRSS